eukprot:TRINITY_DN67665_c0_g1_i1.p1 TRINITY_DN67665_c0_g1~~TRINITY_DN67665_c0_g1_i1.p1  ORF type:complete len:753 (-),score=198.67 TRINITY_DN67665_c0_g1_i1:83-2341(-)
MRPLFRGEGCAVDGGISVAGNPLNRLLDATSGDQFHAQQMREGYLGGGGPPMGPMMGGQMMQPMMGKPGGLDEAWQEAGRMGGPMPGGGPVLGEAMRDQLRQHLEAGSSSGMAHAPGFFSGGPQMMPHAGPNSMEAMEATWAMSMQGVPQGMAPVGPAIRSDWAQRAQSGEAAMEMAFQQAQAKAAMPGPMAANPEAAAQMEMAWSQQGQRPGFMPPSMMGAGLMGPAMAMGPSMMGPGLGMPMGSSGMTMAAASPPAAAVEVTKEAEPEVKVEEAKTAEPVQDDNADLAQAAQMVEMLRNSGNPKFANSKFVNFIDAISKRDLQFKENTVVDRDGEVVDWDSLYDTEAATASSAEVKELGNLWQKSGGLEDGEAALEAMEEAWKNAGGLTDPTVEQIEAMMGSMMNGAGETDFMEGLRPSWMDEMPAAREPTEYSFQENNSYLEGPLDCLAEAQRLLREGRDREAMLALEAEVRRNPESSEGWRLLGQLYAEMDQDVEAIQCLRKGHEVDPYNLDSLLALGVSCTNELDRLPALRYLREWIENHEEHQVLVAGLDPPPEYEMDEWRAQVTMLFQQAAQANPHDADVFVALGVLENINMNYTGAVQALASACRLRPNDHTAWNKLGATLANSGKSEQAVIAYHSGLQLKPNYARSWANLAIAHANLKQYTDAMRFYLSSLVLNPEATHIWNCLHGAVLSSGNMDREIFTAIGEKDMGKMTELVGGVLDPQQLPKPAPSLEQPAEEVLKSMGL